jgi:uncharacterized protein YndB with AHSA1/START domain
MGKMEIEVEGSPGQVWQALISQDALRDWFNATTEIEPREGGRVGFEGTRGEDVFRYEGTIKEIAPNTRIAIDFGDSGGRIATLTFQLQPRDDLTIVQLHHDGFDQRTGDDGTFWNGDELIALRDYVTGIGPTH